MFPGGTVISCPNQGVTLDTGAASPANNERADIGLMRQRAIPRSTRHLGAVNVVRGGMRERSDIRMMDAVFRQRFARQRKVGRFIHVVPKTSHSQLLQARLLLTPPRPRA